MAFHWFDYLVIGGLLLRGLLINYFRNRLRSGLLERNSKGGEYVCV